MPLLLTRSDVESVLTMREAIDAVEDGFRRLAQEKVSMPQRTVIRLPDHHGVHLAMPACIAGDPGVLSVKVVTVYPDNPERFGMPTTIGTLLLNDPRNGSLLALMDAGYLTAVRTGAASGVATRYLAREDARTVGLFGAGAQARTQLWAVCEVRPIECAVVFDPIREARESFAAEMSAKLSIPVTATEDPLECLRADIVVAASSSRTPLFEGAQLRPGTHVNGVGAHSPDARELDAEAMRRSRVVVDHLPACLAEAGEIILAIREGAMKESHLEASLGEVVAGLKPGRRSREEITIFKSVGLAVQDAATADRVYRLALAAGRGTEFRI